LFCCGITGLGGEEELESDRISWATRERGAHTPQRDAMLKQHTLRPCMKNEKFIFKTELLIKYICAWRSKRGEDDVSVTDTFRHPEHNDKMLMSTQGKSA
jgi:hypothetical protein